MVEKDIFTKEELATGTTRGTTSNVRTPLSPEAVPTVIQQGAPCSRDTGRLTPRFKVGDSVIARNLNPPGHTRLPRYARGKVGIIDRVHGTFVYPDTNAHGGGEQPQPLYCVRFDAKELWGPTAQARDSLCVDLWEDYLEPA